MHKVVLTMSVSLDGYIEGPDRDISWHRVDEELHAYFNEHLAGMGAFLSGRVTHQLMADYWPAAGSDPESKPVEVEFSRIWVAKPKVVYSRTLQHADWNTTIEREVTREGVRRLQESATGDLALGGADLTATFLELDLIDEFEIYVHPVVLGRGKPLFPVTDRSLDLSLVESRAFGSGVVKLRYARQRGSGA